MLNFYDINLKYDFYSDYYVKRELEICEKKGYPVLLQLDGKTRLLIFNRVI